MINLVILFIGLLVSCKSYACGMPYALPSEASGPDSLTFAPDGTLLAVTSGMNIGAAGGVTIFNVKEGLLNNGTFYQIQDRYSGDGASSLMFSPNGDLLAVADFAFVTLWPIVGGVPAAANYYPVPGKDLGPLAFSPDGQFLAATSQTQQAPLVYSVTMYSVVGNALQNPVSYALPSGSSLPSSIAFSPDGQYLVTGNGGSNDITIFKVVGGGLVNGISYPGGGSSMIALAFSPNGLYLASVGGNNFVIYDFAEGTVSPGKPYTLPAGPSSEPYVVAFSPQGSLLAIGNEGPPNIAIFEMSDTPANGTAYQLSPEECSQSNCDPLGINFSPDGSLLAVSYLFANGYGVTIFNTADWCVPNASTIPVMTNSPNPSTISVQTNSPSPTSATTRGQSAANSLGLGIKHSLALALGFLGLRAFMN